MLLAENVAYGLLADMDLGQLAGTGLEVHAQDASRAGLPFPSIKAAAPSSPAQTRSSKPQARKSSFDAGVQFFASCNGAWCQ